MRKRTVTPVFGVFLSAYPTTQSGHLRRHKRRSGILLLVPTLVHGRGFLPIRSLCKAHRSTSPGQPDGVEGRLQLLRLVRSPCSKDTILFRTSRHQAAIRRFPPSIRFNSLLLSIRNRFDSPIKSSINEMQTFVCRPARGAFTNTCEQSAFRFVPPESVILMPDSVALSLCQLITMIPVSVGSIIRLPFNIGSRVKPSGAMPLNLSSTYVST